ncbi:MAG: hypothetical protein N838_08660 [Thiohalocapsa sp. PB-PSB1]|jgi:hypothetical protein|nr:MAG: hypothetical protein N838_08660 [Thiohalocapsa sp. PB-PSB1]
MPSTGPLRLCGEYPSPHVSACFHAVSGEKMAADSAENRLHCRYNRDGLLILLIPSLPRYLVSSALPSADPYELLRVGARLRATRQAVPADTDALR